MNIYIYTVYIYINNTIGLVFGRDCKIWYRTEGKEHIHTYRVIQEESAILWEMMVCLILSKKVHMNMGPILNGYRDMVKRRYGPSCEHEQHLCIEVGGGIFEHLL